MLGAVDERWRRRPSDNKNPSRCDNNGGDQAGIQSSLRNVSAEWPIQIEFGAIPTDPASNAAAIAMIGRWVQGVAAPTSQIAWDGQLACTGTLVLGSHIGRKVYIECVGVDGAMFSVWCFPGEWEREKNREGRADGYLAWSARHNPRPALLRPRQSR